MTLQNTSDSVVLRRWKSNADTRGTEEPAARTQRFSFPAITLDIKASFGPAGQLVLEPKVLDSPDEYATEAPTRPSHLNPHMFATKNHPQPPSVKEARRLFAAAHTSSFYTDLFSHCSELLSCSEVSASHLAHVLAATLLAYKGPGETRRILSAISALIGPYGHISAHLVEDEELADPLGVAECQVVCCTLLTSRVCLPTLRARHVSSSCVEQAVTFLALSWLSLITLTAMTSAEGGRVLDQQLPVPGDSEALLSSSLLRRPPTRAELWWALLDFVTEVTDTGVFATVPLRRRRRSLRSFLSAHKWREPMADSVLLHALVLACCPMSMQRCLRPKIVLEWLVLQDLCFPVREDPSLRSLNYRLAPLTQLIESWDAVFSTSSDSADVLMPFSCTEVAVVRLVCRRICDDLTARSQPECASVLPLMSSGGTMAALECLIRLASRPEAGRQLCYLRKLPSGPETLTEENRVLCIDAIVDLATLLVSIFSIGYTILTSERTGRSLSISTQLSSDDAASMASSAKSTAGKYSPSDLPELTPIPSARSIWLNRSGRMTSNYFASATCALAGPGTASILDRMILAFWLLQADLPSSQLPMTFLLQGLRLLRNLGGNLTKLSTQSSYWRDLHEQADMPVELTEELLLWPHNFASMLSLPESDEDLVALRTPRRIGAYDGTRRMARSGQKLSMSRVEWMVCAVLCAIVSVLCIAISARAIARARELMSLTTRRN